MEKRSVKRTERIIILREQMDESTLALLDDLKEKLSEQDMVLSIFQTINAISADVYRIVKDDYRKAYRACAEVKNKVSAFVMSQFESDEGNLAWSYSSIDESLTVYVQ